MGRSPGASRPTRWRTSAAPWAGTLTPARWRSSVDSQCGSPPSKASPPRTSEALAALSGAPVSSPFLKEGGENGGKCELHEAVRMRRRRSAGRAGRARPATEIVRRARVQVAVAGGRGGAWALQEDPRREGHDDT